MRFKTLVFILLNACLAATVSASPQQGEDKAGAPQTRRDLTLETTAPEPARGDLGIVKPPHGYALVIGIARYKNLPEEQQLEAAERDAEAMYSVLISPEGGSFPAENVHKLIGPKATLRNIRYELEEWLPKVANEQDRVVVYYAGHGLVSPQDGLPYISAYDIDIKSISTTGYPMRDLAAVFGNKIKAKWKVLFTDACHSGAIRPEAEVQTINASLMGLDRSLLSLTASHDRESSYESPDIGEGRGLFTYYVQKGLEGSADENRDGLVTASELVHYTQVQVRQASEGKQNPTDGGSYDPNMLLAVVLSNRSPEAPPPPKFGALTFESEQGDVEVFVDGKSEGVISPGKPLRLPGLTEGVHLIQGVRRGFEPDGPREVVVYPGLETTVKIRALIVRRRVDRSIEFFDNGFELYNKGGDANYKKAAESFKKALDIDSKFSLAALYLARSYNAVYDQAKAKQYFQKAIDIDPDYLEARASFAGMLLDIGDLDTAIRQLNAVIQRDKNHFQAYYLLAQALGRKDAFDQSIENAEKAIKLAPANAEARFWLAESLRMTKQYEDAERAYLDYLKLSNFDSRLSGKANYYVVGFLLGKGKKKRAAQHDIWEDLRSLAYFGLCNCSLLRQQYDDAIAYCQKSLTYDAEDPITHFALALAYARKAAASDRIETLAAAMKHFNTLIEINPDIPEAATAKTNIKAIKAALQAQQ